MNAEQKQRATELVSEWNTQYPEYVGDLLQELIDVPEVAPALVVEVEPDYWSGGHYCEGSKPHISPLKVWKLPVGTKLYTAPLVTKLSDERILHHLDAILKASGSGMKNYSMHKTIEDMKQAVRAIEREILGE